MTNSQPTDKRPPRPIEDARWASAKLQDRAKNWWFFSLLLKIIIFFLGVFAIFAAIAPGKTAFVVAIMAIVSGLFKMRSDKIKYMGEGLCRKLDYHDSLGWDISIVDIRDTMLFLGGRSADEITEEKYFASTREIGSRRALENLQESSWFSKHLARTVGHCCLAVIITLVTVSILSLVVSINTIQSFDMLSNIGRVVTSALMLVFALDLIPICFDFYCFAHEAEHAEKNTHEMMNADKLDAIVVVKLWQDYHIARNQSPLIPTWLWKFRRNTLNKMWKEYRA